MSPSVPWVWPSPCFICQMMGGCTHRHTHTQTHNCKTNGHNTVSECQNARQLERQTRLSMFAANRRLSAVTENTHTHTHATTGALDPGGSPSLILFFPPPHTHTHTHMHTHAALCAAAQ